MSSSVKESQELSSKYHDVFIHNYANLVSLLQLKISHLSCHFVSEQIIKLEEKDELTVDFLFNRINLDLRSGFEQSFLKLLDIMEHRGDPATLYLARSIKTELNICATPAAMPSSSSFLVDFDKFDDVNDMFVALVSELRSLLDEKKLPSVRRACIINDKQMGSKLPEDFVEKITAATNLDDLFDTVSPSPFCNWMNIRLLEKMAAASRQHNTTQLIKKYKDTVSSLKLKDVLNHFPKVKITDEHYSKVKAKWNKELDELTVNDIIGHWRRLEIIFDVEDANSLLESIIEGSVVLYWLIPTELVCHARYSVFKMWSSLEDIVYLEVGNHMIKDQKYDFKTTQINSATPYEVIDHFADFLLVTLNDNFFVLMYDRGLVTKDEFDVVTSGPTGYHRNGLILGYVRQMDTTGLVIFYEVIMESHPDITIPLMDALQSTGIVYPASLQSASLKVSHLIEPSRVTETQLSSLPAKRHISPEQGDFIKPSMVNLGFLKLIDKLNETMQFCDLKMIVDLCSSLMASDIHKIAVFPPEFVDSLHNYSHTSSVLKILSSFWTWSDHSVLRTILESDKAALKLLEEFDSRLDPSHQIASYPLPPPATCMTPCDGSTHTILAIKCARHYHQCLLTHVFDVRSLLVDKCDITSHSLQLLATKSSSTVMYWMIPKSVVTLISTKTIEYSSYFNSQGITEVDIYPGLRIETKPSSLGPLGLLTAQPPSKFAVVTEVMEQPEKLPTVVEQLLVDNEQKIILQENEQRRQVDAMEAYNKEAEVRIRQMEKTIRNQTDKLEKMEAVMREVESSKQGLEEEVQQQVLKQKLEDTITSPPKMETTVGPGDSDRIPIPQQEQTVLPSPSTRPQVKEQLLRQPISVTPAATATAKKDDSEKGYNFDFVRPPPEGLLCKICNLPARDPIQTFCCGETFCRNCVSKYQSSTNTSCPNTKCEEQNVEFMNDKRAEREIGDLAVYCTHKTVGCSWVGELRSIQHHLNVGTSTSTSCQYTEISCSNNCGMVMQRSLLEEHLNSECELRQERCQHCGLVDRYQWISGGHQQECQKYPMKCPNHCKVGCVRRDEMSMHLEECPLAMVKCPFAVVGCNSVVRRSEMMGHIEAATTQHVEYMIRGISSTITQLRSAKELFEQKTQELQVHFDNTNVINRTDLENVHYNLLVTMSNVVEAKKTLTGHDERLKALLAEAQSLRQRAIDVEIKLQDHFSPALDDLKHQLKGSSEQLRFEVQKVYDAVTTELQGTKLSVGHAKESVKDEMDAFRDELFDAKKSVKHELSITDEEINKRLTADKISVDKMNSQLQESSNELETYKGEVEMLKLKFETKSQDSKGSLKVIEEELVSTKEQLKKSQVRFEVLLKLFDWNKQLKFLHATSSDSLPDVFLKMTEFTKHKNTKEVWYSPPFHTGDKGYKMCLSVSLHTAGYVSVCVLLMSGKNDHHLRWPIKGTLRLQLLNQHSNDYHTLPLDIVFDGSRDSACCEQVMVGERARFGNYYGKFIQLKHLNDMKRKTQYLIDDTLYFKLLAFVTPET